jgi:hypothetical protein
MTSSLGMKMRLTLMPWEKRTRMLATDMTYSYYQIPSASRSKSDTRMQIVILKDTDSNHAILKHMTCPEKVKPNMLRSLVYGTQSLKMTF